MDSIGYELFINLVGVPIARPVPDPTQAVPNWVFSDGQQGITSGHHTWTATGVSNNFIIGSNSSKVRPPVRGLAQDNNPQSAMRVTGPFGVRSTFQSNAFIGNEDEATDAALKALALSEGSAETCDVTVLVNPAWDIDDVATFDIASLNLYGNFVIDSIKHGFTAKEDTELVGRLVTPA